MALAAASTSTGTRSGGASAAKTSEIDRRSAALATEDSAEADAMHDAATNADSADSTAPTKLLEASVSADIVAAVVIVTTAIGKAARFFTWKHIRHNTGRPCVGLNGTVVSTLHSEHVVRVSVRESPAAAGPVPFAAAASPDRRDLHGLHRFGSFLNCLS